MKVLWISHDPLILSNDEDNNCKGSWGQALFNLLNKEKKHIIGVASPGRGKAKKNDLSYLFQYPKKKTYSDLPNTSKKDLLWIINDFRPEIIHVWGTEKPYGLIVKNTKIPVVISLQGFISECYNALLGEIAIPVWRKERTLKEYILRNSYFDLHSDWFINSAYENEIVRLNKYFIGRTNFDRNFISKNNQNACYFKGNELLRNDFYKTEWDISKIKRHSIYLSSFSNPLKGFHILLNSIKYLVDEFPDLEIIVPGCLTKRNTSKMLGNSYYRIINKIIQNNNLKERIRFVGKLDAKQVCQILQYCHVFVLSSLIENSSNALCEAQIVGTPCIVSSNCGGTSSLVTDNHNGLIFNKGDYYDLAMKIRNVFIDDNLALSLSNQGRKFGHEFNNPQKILAQYASIYTQITGKNNDKS